MDYHLLFLTETDFNFTISTQMIYHVFSCDVSSASEDNVAHDLSNK